MNREQVNQQLWALVAQYQRQGRTDLATQLQQYIQSDWAGGINDPQLQLAVKDIVQGGGFTYGQPASQHTPSASPPNLTGQRAQVSGSSGVTAPPLLDMSLNNGASPSGYQERGPGYSPVGPSSTVPQITPGGANTLNTQQLANQLGTGGPPAAPNAGGGGATPGITPMSTEGWQNQVLGTPGELGDDTMLQALMERIGIDLGNPGLYGGVIAKQINEYLPYFRALLGLQGDLSPGTVNTRFTSGLDSLAGMLQNNTFYSGMQDYAKQTQPALLAGLTGPTGIKDVGKQQQYLNSLLALSGAGQNPLLQQASADSASRAWLGYRSANLANPPGTAGNPGNYVDWLLGQNNPQFGPLLSILGGAEGR